ncbi:MAG: biopolymer transporter ExbD [Oligoflexia bacterium]|nr:biopolymer transporter ExbD [Oligoflexia bacterium]
MGMGSMGDNRNSRDGHDDIVAEINMTPLIDIMLVLLILFMVTSSVSLESGLDVDLPEASTTSEQSGEQSVVIISLDKSGNISINGEKTTLETIQEDLKKSFETEKTDLVILEGDKNSTLEMTIQLMDLAKQAGAKKFAIAASESN